MMWAILTTLGSIWLVFSSAFFLAHTFEFNEAKDMEEAYRKQEEMEAEQKHPSSGHLKYIRAQKENHRKWKEQSRRRALRSPLAPFIWIAHGIKWITGPFKP